MTRALLGPSLNRTPPGCESGTLPEGLFSSPCCLECGLCCRGTEMILLREDVERLEGAGFRREHFVVERGGFLRLRNVDGRCVFYDEASGRCSAYELKPLGRRLHPLVFDEVLGVRFDTECPLSAEFSRRCDEVERACELLAELLDGLREEYGYEYDERLLVASSRRLLSSCRGATASAAGAPPSPAPRLPSPRPSGTYRTT